VLSAQTLPRLMLALLLPTLALADCIPIAEAKNHVGETRCVTGKVVRVKTGNRGVTFFDFCEDYRLCPFTVVVFSSDLKSVGDVRQLQGRIVEIHGPVIEYDGRAEIILKQPRQLTGEGAQIPPLPKNYDVANKGRYSAGKFSYPKAARKPRRKRQTAPIPTEESSDESGSPP
jgi:hypothetical protein